MKSLACDKHSSLFSQSDEKSFIALYSDVSPLTVTSNNLFHANTNLVTKFQLKPVISLAWEFLLKEKDKYG